MGIFARKPNIEKLAAKKDIEGLTKALLNKETSLRLKAVEALGGIKEGGAVQPLIKALEDKDEDVRAETAKALGKIKDPRAVDPLIRALEKEGPRAKIPVIWALGEIKDARAVEPLIQTLKDYFGGVRRKVAEAPGAVEFVAQAVMDKDMDPGIPREVEEALGKIGEPAVESLNNALKDENEGVQEVAKRALGKIKAKESTRNKTEKESAVKPKVKRIVLFWEHAPKAKEAQTIIDQLPQWHPELDFQAALATDERLPSGSVEKCVEQFDVGTVANRLVNAINDDGGRIENYDIESISKMTLKRMLDIATIQIIEKELQKKYGFKHVDYPNRLICKVIMTKIDICHYALILDSEIDLSNYNIHTPGVKGYKLSTLFWEVANT